MRSTCQHQHIAPGDSRRPDYSKLRLLCRGRSISVPKAAEPNNHASGVRGCHGAQRLSSILVLTSVQLTILGWPKGNERADSRQSGLEAALRWTGAERFLSHFGW